MGFHTPAALIFLVVLLPGVTIYQRFTKSGTRAVLFVTFFAALFGPEVAFIKLPGIPPLDKHNLPYVYLMIAAVVSDRRRLSRAKPLRGLDFLAIILAFSGFVTMANNPEPLTFGGWGGSTTLPGLVINDGIQMCFQAFTGIYLPFLLGKAYVRTRRDVRMLMRFLTAMALVQAGFVLIEIRLSPIVHIWAYGYGAHSDFLQTIRWGGYRPMNFTAHGLALAIFMVNAVLATTVNTKNGERIKVFGREFRSKTLLIALLVILVLCKSTGAILFALAFVPLLLRGSFKAQRRVALAMAVLLLSYPLLRATQWIPADDLVAAANSTVGPERAESLEFRFNNEEDLLERALEKSWFGWGGQGRRNIFSMEDGRELSVSDGAWIIVFGMLGIVGFACSFGLIALPVIRLAASVKSMADEADWRLVGGLLVIVAAFGIDLIANGLYSKYIYLLAGACAGVRDEILSGSGWAAAPTAAPSPHPPRRRR